MDICSPDFQPAQLQHGLLNSLVLPEGKALEFPDVPDVALNLYGLPQSTAAPGPKTGISDQTPACLTTHISEAPLHWPPATAQGYVPGSPMLRPQIQCKAEPSTTLIKQEQPLCQESEPETEPSADCQQAPGSHVPAAWQANNSTCRRSLRKRRAVPYSADSGSELDWVVR